MDSSDVTTSGEVKADDFISESTSNNSEISDSDCITLMCTIKEESVDSETVEYENDAETSNNVEFQTSHAVYSPDHSLDTDNSQCIDSEPKLDVKQDNTNSQHPIFISCDMVKVEIEDMVESSESTCVKEEDSTLSVTNLVHDPSINEISQRKCKQCQRTVHVETSIENHDDDDDNIQCESCQRGVLIQSHRGQEFHVRPGQGPFICPICNKEFPHNTAINRHYRIHSGERPYKCQYCEKCFPDTSDLKRHVRIHTGDRPFKCPHCDKSFTQNSSRKKHIRIHTGDRPYKCRYCEKAFFGHSDLVLHTRTHTGDRPYKCQYCEKAFSGHSDLNRHTKVHIGDRPFKCQQCDKSFARNTDLNVHTRIHTGDRPFRCNICDTPFSRHSDLKRHVNNHIGDRPFKCPHCSKGFARRNDLQKHIRRMHNSSSDEVQNIKQENVVSK